VRKLLLASIFIAGTLHAVIAYGQNNGLPSLTEEQIGRIATCIKTYPVDQIINGTDEWLPLEMPLPVETSHMTEEQRTEFNRLSTTELPCDCNNNGRIMKRLHIPSIINILTPNELLWLQEPVFINPETGTTWDSDPIIKLKSCEEKRTNVAVTRLAVLMSHLSADHYQKNILNKNDQLSNAEKDALRIYHTERVAREIFEKSMLNRLIQITKESELTKEQKNTFNRVKEDLLYFTSHETEIQNVRDEDFILRLKDHQRI